MHNPNANAVPETRDADTFPCCLCSEPVDPRKLCAVWKDGRVAHLSCYNAGWLRVGISDQVLGERGLA